MHSKFLIPRSASICVWLFASLTSASLIAETSIDDASNMLKNPKLETVNEGAAPIDWTLGDSGEMVAGVISEESDATESGGSALSIEHPPGGGYYTQIRQLVELMPGKEYTLRARAKSENLVGGSPNGSAMIGLFTTEGNNLGHVRVDSLGEWVDLETVIENNPDRSTNPAVGQVIIYFDAVEGQLLIEDVGLFEVPGDEIN